MVEQPAQPWARGPAQGVLQLGAIDRRTGVEQPVVGIAPAPQGLHRFLALLEPQQQRRQFRLQGAMQAQSIRLL
jgi:hypothetical protein